MTDYIHWQGDPKLIFTDSGEAVELETNQACRIVSVGLNGDGDPLWRIEMIDGPYDGHQFDWSDSWAHGADDKT